MVRIYALTGTPGTGKSTVASLLARPLKQGGALRVLEVSELVGRRPREGAARRTVLVDMDVASRKLRAMARRRGPHVVVVGHLAHLLPVRRVLLLRCRPDELERRLRARGESSTHVRANVESEIVDLVLMEAVEHRRTIWEIDTTRKSPAQVARWARAVIAGKVPEARGMVDWVGQGFPRGARRAGRPSRPPRPGRGGRRAGPKR